MQQDYGIPISMATDEELVAELRRRGAVACIVTVDDIRPLVDAEETCAAYDEDAANELARRALKAMQSPLNFYLHEAGTTISTNLWNGVRKMLLGGPEFAVRARDITPTHPPHHC